MVSIDFFTVPTARLRVLFVLVVLAHHRRRVVHVNVAEHPTAAWTAQQLVDAFPDESAPAYLIRDRDRVYGQPFRHRVKGMGIEEVLTTPQSPWQNPFAERLIGSIQRECLNHVLDLGERHLHRILTRYLAYYHQARTHLALDKDAPDLRPIELPVTGKIVQLPEVGGLHPSLRPSGCAVTGSSALCTGGRSVSRLPALARPSRIRWIRAPAGILGTSVVRSHARLAAVAADSGRDGAEGVGRGIDGEGQVS